MNPDHDTQSALIRARPADLAHAGAKSLAARGRAELRRREEAEEWLRKGLALRESALAVPGGGGPWNPYARPPTPEELIRTIIPTYVEQVSAGVSPEVAAQRLGMTPEAQELAHTLQFFMPDTFAEFVQEEANRKAQVLQKREALLTGAFGCFEKGHELDSWNPELLYWLADSYCGGCGVRGDKEMAAAFYRRAGDQGHSGAQYCLGVLYSDGEGVPQDEAEAAAWFRKAAEQGNTDAQISLGFAYKTGRGIPKDYAQGAMWLRRAGEREDFGDEGAAPAALAQSAQAPARASQSDPQKFQYKGRTFSVGQKVKVDGRMRTVKGMNQQTGKIIVGD